MADASIATIAFMLARLNTEYDAPRQLQHALYEHILFLMPYHAALPAKITFIFAGE